MNPTDYTLHGTWVPEYTGKFLDGGAFYLWVETPPGKPKRSNVRRIHPNALNRAQLALMIDVSTNNVVGQVYCLPGGETSICDTRQPMPPTAEWGPWKIWSYRTIRVFALWERLAKFPGHWGADILFWYRYSQVVAQGLRQGQFIPAIRANAEADLFAGWELLLPEQPQWAEAMPLACRTLYEDGPKVYDASQLLQHFTSEVVDLTIREAARDLSLPSDFLRSSLSRYSPRFRPDGVEHYQAWWQWRNQVWMAQGLVTQPFQLGFIVQEPTGEDPNDWQVHLVVIATQQKDCRVLLSDFWALEPGLRETAYPLFGERFEAHLLIALDRAAQIWSALADLLATASPAYLSLDLAGAFQFLTETAWQLQDQGYLVVVPTWWTGQGRRRAKLRLQTSAPATEGPGYFSLGNVINYQYELALDGEAIPPEEWQRLVNAKLPLVQFRGQWLRLDQDHLKDLLKRMQAPGPTGLIDLIRTTAAPPEDVEVHHDQTLQDLFGRLQDKSRLEMVDDPPALQGQLRPYQKRAVSWLCYLEQLGLGACLADDMGLGKTIAVIARLLQERQQEPPPPATLLVVPTSVVGNWFHELHRFAPSLKAVIHHGSGRTQDLQALAQNHDVVITSYNLARIDEARLAQVPWHRLVLDEAQNIKNPLSQQTRALQRLPALHRLALTGTPVENRLLDLWSILQFLNPGYLGSQSNFQSRFEGGNPEAQQILKRLIEPFVLRRVKTDPAIIQDLPDKTEQKVFCNLTREQAALYEAVVREVTRQLEGLSGIARKGLILATLTKLKQVCNHPAHFLKDNSDFTRQRSHKLALLEDMLEEVVDNRESALIFSQYRELAELLASHLKGQKYTTYLLHGGIPRPERERMVKAFQEGAPALFVLSLKAGGVGINLTRANHVFHFDRWWNPAVESQATDRAFRIGQARNVFVHKFVTLGTLEERIDQMLEDKQKLAQSVVSSDESWLSELDNDRFRELILLTREALLE